MKKLLSALLAATFALGSLSVMACPGEKAKDEKHTGTPAKLKI